jgi:hypothetical protein
MEGGAAVIRICGAALAAIVLTACEPSGSAAPRPTPAPTAQDVSARPAKSAMRDGQFAVSGDFWLGATAYPATGDGVLVVRPAWATRLNVQVDAGGLLGRVGADVVEIGGRQYVRVGLGGWTARDTTGAAGTLFTSDPSLVLAGEETLPGGRAWHIRRAVDTTTYDGWVRESDGYVLRITVDQTRVYRLQLDLTEFNTGAAVTAPV